VLGAIAFAFTATDATWMILGWLLTAVIFVGALRRHRVSAAVAAFATGLGPWWDGFIVFGAVFLGLAFWLVASRQVLHERADRRGPRR
jgi:hypothetical protein